MSFGMEEEGCTATNSKGNSGVPAAAPSCVLPLSADVANGANLTDVAASAITVSAPSVSVADAGADANPSSSIGIYSQIVVD